MYQKPFPVIDMIETGKNIVRLREELGEGAWVAATGEVPEAVLKAMTQPVRRCEDLILDGMYAIWRKNQK